jgi:hypothetical protein
MDNTKTAQKPVKQAVTPSVASVSPAASQKPIQGAENEQKKPFTGHVRGVRGQIVEVGYDDNESLPKFFDVLTSPENPKVRLPMVKTTRCFVYPLRSAGICFAICALNQPADRLRCR